MRPTEPVTPIHAPIGAIAKHIPRTILASHDKRFKYGYINKNKIAIGTRINDNLLS